MTNASLAGKKALVTGGSRGIGAAIARRLAADGADVAFTYQQSAAPAEALVRELADSGRNGVAIKADAADPVAVKGAVDEAARALGGLDILVNNAGIFRGGPIDDLTLDDIDQTLAVNVRAVVVASQAALAHIKEGGSIISIGSCLAERVTEPHVSLYALSKAALIGWTKGLARDLGPRGITVSIVHPGSTDTDMNPADGEGAETQRERMAIKRYGRPDDIAALIAFIAGPEGRSINGTGLTIDGGANA
ncbi:MAG: SDR family oxidoreductase [Sphingosinicella sp.]|nr:SDR family oxidoreductase [Sphingosinicella sp.]